MRAASTTRPAKQRMVDLPATKKNLPNRDQYNKAKRGPEKFRSFRLFIQFWFLLIGVETCTRVDLDLF